MTQARAGQTATLLLDGSVLVAGGSSGNGADILASAEVYDPSRGRWTVAGPMTQARTYHTAIPLLDGSVLVMGGSNSKDFTGGAGGNLASAEVYHPSTRSWSATGSMLAGRAVFTATRLSDGRVLVAGGIGHDYVALATAELYDPRSGTWTATGQMHVARFWHTATLLSDGKVLVAGGEPGGSESDSSALASAELFDPSTGSWTLTGEMGKHRGAHTATSLSDGRVLVEGGQNDRSAELYDVATGAWVATGDMVEPRGHDTAARLSDGSVLIVGGFRSDGSGEVLATTEMYQPSRGVWVAASTMTGPRESHTATLLLDGRVLLAGGNNLSFEPEATAELCIPSGGG